MMSLSQRPENMQKPCQIITEPQKTIFNFNSLLYCMSFQGFPIHIVMDGYVFASWFCEPAESSWQYDNQLNTICSAFLQ